MKYFVTLHIFAGPFIVRPHEDHCNVMQLLWSRCSHFDGVITLFQGEDD